MVDWNLAGNANPFADFAQGFQQGRDNKRQRDQDNIFAQRQQFQIQQAQRQQEAQDRALQQQQAVGAAVAKDDYAGARQAAGGDFDLIKSINELDDRKRAQLAETNDYAARQLFALKGLPPEQQTARWQQIVPTLVQRGAKAEDLNIDFNDPTAIEREIAESMSLKDMIERAEKQKPKPDWRERKKADGSTEWFDINAEAGPPAGVPASSSAPSGGFEGAIGPLLKREGGFVAKDGRSGAPANYGINQKHNPDVDVASLTPERAKQLYKTRYWDAAGLDQIPAEAQNAVFDAAVNQGPERARQWWQQAGGNLAAFNELRLRQYRSLPDYAENGKSWERRVQETGGYQVAQAGGPPPGRTIRGDAPQPKTGDAPSGYRQTADGNLTYIPGGPADPAVRALGTGSKREFASLRKEFNGLDEVKQFKDVSASYRQVRALAGKPNPTPADDTALTFSFMKMLDPGSVVREGEFALVGKSAGLPDQIVMQLAKVDQGKGLTPTIRQRLVQSAATILLQRREAYDSVSRNYRGIAEELGANPDQLAEDPGKWRGRIKQSPQKSRGAAAATTFSDPGKEARYQAWLKANGGR